MIHESCRVCGNVNWRFVGHHDQTVNGRSNGGYDDYECVTCGEGRSVATPRGRKGGAR